MASTTDTDPAIDGPITRRDALLRVSALFGGAALVGHAALLAGCASGGAERRSTVADLFGARELALLDELAETILPETGTPGAKAAGVGSFLARMVTDAYDGREQRIFMDGLARIERECARRNGTDFVAASPAQRLELVEQLDREQFEAMRNRPDTATPHYFRMIKELTLLGYFTSEIGYTRAMRYTETPARFDPCVPYTPGEKAWAPHA
jgi:hypothetical protein